PAIVAGGGAPEMEAAFRVREWATELSGREQLAAIAFADALETIPLTLAENAGLDVVDMEVELRSNHRDGKKWFGVDVFNAKTGNMLKQDVIEPLSVKEQIINSATEAATMILRIDDVVAASAMQAPPGGPEGMGGPPGGMEY
ncbi:MAG: TCP-1/cpn60 chaperonin family protein, partial [Candidatus Geothermarchaeales archaeon]